MPNVSETQKTASVPEAVNEPVAEAAPEATEAASETVAEASEKEACPAASAEQTEAESAETDAVHAEPAGAPDTVSEVSHVSYNPQSDTYSYSRPDANGAEQVNGCAWNNTGAPVHAKPAKSAKKSSKGFKVFAASMLTVFTVSAVAIASFMAADYFKGSDSLKVAGNSPDTTVTRNADVRHSHAAFDL